MSLIGKSIGNYVIKSKLGEGGMGTVYLGEHPLIGKRVAVKVLLEDMASKEDIVARFFHEAKAVNDIGHPNIVDILDFGKLKKEDGRELFYIIMEYLEGQSLQTRIQGGAVPIADSVRIMTQCCSALAASHKKGIVHRDLKPDNIFLCPRAGDPNFVKILDFGIAKLTGNTAVSPTFKTRTGSIVGTPAYMSPEQCEGTQVIDHRSDIYSLGVVLYQIVTGRLPFRGEGFGEVIVGHLTRTPDRPSQVNPAVPLEVESVVLRALEKDRSRRFQTMDEFGAALADPAAHQAEYAALPHRTKLGHDAPPVEVPPMGGTRLLDPGTAAQVAPRTPAPRTGPGRARQRGRTGERATTLSGAASEVFEDATRRSPFAIVAAAGAAIMLAAVLILVLRLRGSEPKPPLPSPTVAANPTPERVTLTIASDPSGARVFRSEAGSEVELGTTPLAVQTKRGERPVEIVVKMDGYKPESRTLGTDTTRDVLIGLAREAAPPLSPTPTPTGPVSTPVTVRHRTRRVPVEPSTKGKTKDDDLQILRPKF